LLKDIKLVIKLGTKVISWNLIILYSLINIKILILYILKTSILYNIFLKIIILLRANNR